MCIIFILFCPYFALFCIYYNQQNICHLAFQKQSFWSYFKPIFKHYIWIFSTFRPCFTPLLMFFCKISVDLEINTRISVKKSTQKSTTNYTAPCNFEYFSTIKFRHCYLIFWAKSHLEPFFNRCQEFLSFFVLLCQNHSSFWVQNNNYKSNEFPVEFSTPLLYLNPQFFQARKNTEKRRNFFDLWSVYCELIKWSILDDWRVRNARKSINVIIVKLLMKNFVTISEEQ